MGDGEAFPKLHSSASLRGRKTSFGDLKARELSLPLTGCINQESPDICLGSRVEGVLPVVCLAVAHMREKLSSLPSSVTIYGRQES